MASTCFFAGPWIEQAVDGWSNWMYRTVALLSLASHLILVVFADIRRRKSRSLRRGLVWVAYQLTDWAPAYIMGNLYIETSPCKKMIFAFWVPFLLLHNARPDNISAYSMGDSGLSARLTIVVPFQTLGSIYLMCRYILADYSTGLLRWASCIMLFLGIFKYIESGVALWRADLGYIWRSFKQQRQRQHPSSFGDDYGGGREQVLEDEKALLVAHDLFDICKGAFSDYPVDLRHHKTGISMFSGRWESMCKVVEMELSLMYDILYTKAAVVHTWHGYAIRLASPFLTAIALLLFGLQCKEGLKNSLKTEDTVISYVLLVTTFLLDVRCLLSAVTSAWTHSYFKHMQNNWLKHEFWCLERWENLRRFVVPLGLSRLSMWLGTCECAKEPKSYRRWQGKFQGRNMLSECTRGWDTLYSRFGLLKKIGWEDQPSGLRSPDYVRELKLKHVCTQFFAPAVQFVDNMEDDPPGLPDPSQKDPVGMRLTPVDLEQNVQAAQSMPIHSEQVDHWSLGHANFMYGQALPELYEQQTDHRRYDRALPEAYERVYLRRHAHTGSNYDGARPDMDEKAARTIDQSDEDMSFPPEFQEVILIWHIATDIFLLCSPKIIGGVLEEHVKGIKELSDYMMFLATANHNMLPGRKFHTMYKTTLSLLKMLARESSSSGYTGKEKLSMWMLDHKDHLRTLVVSTTNHLERTASICILAGTQLAGKLLSPRPKYGERMIMKAEEHMLKGHAHWIPGLANELPGGTEGMLEFILDAWVRLLMFASLRCSRDSHAKQLSYGGELTTLVWIITEHTEKSVLKKHLKTLLL
ncbi:hypothetical protein VPH35_011314 [Triticum aestivum]